MTDAPMLAYESARHDALEAGEQVLWTGAPRPSHQFRRHLIIIAVAGVVVATGLGSLVREWVATFVCAGCYALITGFWLLKDYLDISAAERRRYRITDRRISVLHSRRQFRMSMKWEDLESMIVHSSRKGILITASGFRSGAKFDRTPDSEMVEFLILSAPQRIGRRFLVRRGQPFAGSPMIPTMVDSMDQLQLQPGEVLLWTGRPRVWDRFDRKWWIGRLRRLAWAAFPTIILSICVYYLRADPPGAGPWFFGFISAIWLFGSLKGIFYEPFSSAKLRRRSSYFLTNLRAVIRVQASETTTRSVLLDMVDHVSVSVDGDGWGDVEIQGLVTRFERIENAADVHRMLVDAIRSAGGPLPGQTVNAASQ